MRAWAWLLGGLLIWAVHFFALYGVGSVLLTSFPARIATLVISIACLVAAALLWRAARRQARADRLDRWMDRIASWAGALAFVAVLWQALPALLI